VGQEGADLNLLIDSVHWIADADHWQGSAGIPHRLLEHIELSALALVCAMLVSIPAGVLLGHIRRGGLLAVSVVNIGRAIPTFAILAVTLPLALWLNIDYGFWPTWAAVFLLALPPMFTNAYTAVRQVDPESVDAARGMGLTDREVLLGVEVPLGAPVILAAIRVSAVQVVATVPLGAVVGWGGLGRFLLDGLASYDYPQVVVGATLVALLAIGTEVAFGLVERFLLPRGVRRLNRAEAAATVVTAS
jgi:osmoprotectant transport system permease protein